MTSPARNSSGARSRRDEVLQNRCVGLRRPRTAGKVTRCVTESTGRVLNKGEVLNHSLAVLKPACRTGSPITLGRERASVVDGINHAQGSSGVQFRDGADRPTSRHVADSPRHWRLSGSAAFLLRLRKILVHESTQLVKESIPGDDREREASGREKLPRLTQFGVPRTRICRRPLITVRGRKYGHCDITAFSVERYL